jgi:2-polyprenyl-6-methoxyphenol hydroxylase-like FAD-dependent oxidoreductase
MQAAIPVAIVGAGPVGLACALRLATFGIHSVVLEAQPRLIPQGSKACCVQGDVVEILDKVGVADAIMAEGVRWRIGRTYVRGRQLYAIEYPPNNGFSPWVNLSQLRTQQIMLDRLGATRRGEVRWSHRVTGVAPDDEGVTVDVDTPDGPRSLRAGYLVACDGVHSDVRRVLGIGWDGYRHGDRFLIADIRAALPLAHERHFHYDPPFNPGRQLVMHAQPDDVWRIDWQLAPDADIEAEQRSGRLDQRIRTVIGDIPYEVRWWSTYRFNQRIVTRMRVGRVFLAGDAAHALPPYGARGMNSGIQDIDNLAWKLHLALTGRAPDALLETYHIERHAAAQENLRVTGNTLRFMAPASRTRRWVRDALLAVAPVVKPLRRWVDSGKMAQPFVYTRSPIVDERPDDPLVGAFAPDGRLAVDGKPVRLRELLGHEFVGLYLGADEREALRFADQTLQRRPEGVPLRFLLLRPEDERASAPPESPRLIVGRELGSGLAATYRAHGARWYLIRPDGHICARDGSGPASGDGGMAAALERGVAKTAPDAVPVPR